MRNKIVYTSHSLSALHMLQGMGVCFLLAGLALSFKLLAAPINPSVSQATYQVWAAALAAVAILAPIGAWFYARRVVASVAVSDDQQVVFVKTASILTPAADCWPTHALKIVSHHHGEATFGLPRVALTGADGERRRRYTLALKSEGQLHTLVALIQPGQPAHGAS